MQRLKEFIETNDPTLELNRLSLLDCDIKQQWKTVKENRLIDKRKIKSYSDVLFLIDCFERCVLNSPIDIKLRNRCKHEMLIAQYKAILGLKVLYEKFDTISILQNTNFPTLTNEEINAILLRVNSIINKI